MPVDFAIWDATHAAYGELTSTDPYIWNTLASRGVPYAVYVELLRFLAIRCLFDSSVHDGRSTLRPHPAVLEAMELANPDDLEWITIAFRAKTRLGLEPPVYAGTAELSQAESRMRDQYYRVWPPDDWNNPVVSQYAPPLPSYMNVRYV